MKRILMILSVMILTVSQRSEATDYLIQRLNTPSIQIGNTTYKKGDKFSDTRVTNIKWANSAQKMEVKNLSTGRLMLLSKSAFESKGVQSVKDFFTSTSRASSRGDQPNMSVKRSPKAAAFGEKRLALVIGNSNYISMSYLRNAQTDAADISTSLQNLGFDVIESFETDYTDMKTALNSFATMGADYDVVLFYYAGHGVQEDGVNYLIPVDNPMEFKSNLKEALNADDVLGIMEACGARNRMLFLDACRSPQIAWNRSAKAGLAKMEGAAGSVIMFSTESGKVASDGEDGSDNSPFASAFMQNIVSSDPLSVVLANVCNTTYELTGERQWPMQVGNLKGNFYFNPNGAKATATVTQPGLREQAQPRTTVARTETAAAPIRSQGDPQPKMSIDTEYVVPWIGQVRRVGPNVIISLYLTNTGRKTMYCNIGEPEFYDCSGNLYKRSNGNLVFEVQKDSYASSWVMPGQTMSQIKLTLKGYPENCDMIPYATIGFRGMESGNAYGDAELTIKDMRIGMKAPYEWRAQLPSVSFDVEDVDVQVSKAKIVNGVATFQVTFTNKTNKMVNAGIVGREGCTGFLTMAVDGDGIAHKLGETLSISSGNENAGKCNLPPGVPKQFTVKVRDFDATAGCIPVFAMAFRDMPTSESYGMATLIARNIPME